LLADGSEALALIRGDSGRDPAGEAGPGASSEFLVFEESPSSSPTAERSPESGNALLGCVLVEYGEGFSSPHGPEKGNKCRPLRRPHHLPGQDEAAAAIFHASFGMMSVPARNGRRGIGSQLLSAVEARVRERASDLLNAVEQEGADLSEGASLSEQEGVSRRGKERARGGERTEERTEERAEVRLRMPLISLREDLSLWYGKRGFAEAETEALPEALAPMVAPEFAGRVSFRYMQKLLCVPAEDRG